MTKRTLSVLVLINAVLLAAVSAVLWEPQPAQAQLGIGGQYQMIAGEITGRTDQSAVWVIDRRTQRLVALLYNGANQKLDVIAGREIGADVNGGAGGGPGRQPR